VPDTSPQSSGPGSKDEEQGPAKKAATESGEGGPVPVTEQQARNPTTPTEPELALAHQQ
jgi:hypothetical protein